MIGRPALLALMWTVGPGCLYLAEDPEIICRKDRDCEGDDEVCVRGECLDGCQTSYDCDSGLICSEDLACIEGCKTDADCVLFEERCNDEGQCEPR